MAQAGASGCPGSPSTAIDGTRPNDTAYGAQLSAVDFRWALYCQAEATATRCAAPAHVPTSSDSGTQASSASRAAVRTVATRSAPCTTGLSRRSTARSRAASTQSLLHPTDSWPDRNAAATATDRAPRPAEADSAVATAVTATVGPG